MACCQQDYRVKFTTAAELTNILVEAKQDGRLSRKIEQMARYDVVILDELGYVPFDKQGADLLFRFITRVYERRSVVVTTNLPFAKWSDVEREDHNAAGPRGRGNCRVRGNRKAVPTATWTTLHVAHSSTASTTT